MGPPLNAEKMITATQLWLQHQQFIADRADSRDIDRKTMISEIVEYIHEDEKTNPNRANRGSGSCASFLY